eukprot:gene12202-16276_t
MVTDSSKSQGDADKNNKSASQPTTKLSKSDNCDIETDEVSEGDGVDCDDDEGDAGKGEGGSNEVANNSNGRWARHEHQRFLEGLQKFGKEWKRVAAHVKTRTVNVFASWQRLTIWRQGTTNIPFLLRPLCRPGPVVVDVPKDVQFATGTYHPPRKSDVHISYSPRVKGDATQIRKAV